MFVSGFSSHGWKIGRAFLISLLAAAAMAHASSGGAVQAANRHHLAEMVPFEVQNPHDGTMLRGHVYLPDTAHGERVGTVLVLSPYWGTTREATDELAREDGTLIGRADWFLAEGFAYAAVNLRGTGRSEGCVDFGGKEDQGDAYEIVEGLASQPWSNGKVGMFGLSFDGWSQYMALAGHPPSLKAIVPVSGVIDYWSVISRNGAAFVTGPAAWPLFAGLVTSGVSRGPQGQTSPDHFTCADYPSDLFMNETLIWNGDRAPYWEERDYRKQISSSDVPVFMVNGTLRVRAVNENYASEGEGHILQFEGLWDRLTPGKRKFLIGPWAHGYPRPARGTSSEESDDWFRPMVIEWFDTYLRETSRRRYDEVLYQDAEYVWNRARSWPPSGKTVALPLSGEGLLAPGARAEKGDRTFQSGFNSADRNPSPSNCTPDQVMYASPPAARDVELAGNFIADVSLSSTLPDGNLAAFLYATKGDGSCPDTSARELSRALTDLRHWKYTGYGEDFPIMKPTRIKLRSEPFAATLHIGERLILVIGGDATELFPEFRRPALTVHTGPSLESSLHLPLSGGVLRFEK